MKIVKIILIVIIIGLFISAFGRASMEHGFKEGVEYHQHIIESCQKDREKELWEEWYDEYLKGSES